MNLPQKITLIGTGLMGQRLSRNLMAAGHNLTVWNRSAHRTLSLIEEGAKTADTVAETLADAQVVISMLSDGFATGELLSDLDVQSALTPGTIWIDMSSAKPEHARAHSALLGTLGVSHLDAPVSGGPPGAEEGTLAILAGGDAAIVEDMRAIFEAMGRPVYVGPSGSGMLCKLANQTIVAVTISAVAEATLLAEKGGADPVALRAALKGGFADSVVLQQHGERMSEGNFIPGGLSKFQLKDLDNTLAEAASLGLALPSTQEVRNRFAHFCKDMGGADLDHSGLYLELKKRNNLT